MLSSLSTHKIIYGLVKTILLLLLLFLLFAVSKRIDAKKPMACIGRLAYTLQRIRKIT